MRLPKLEVGAFSREKTQGSEGTLMMYMMISVAVVIIFITVLRWKKRQRAKLRSNVIYLKNVRKQRTLQKCSKCNKKGELRFYSDPSGNVTGMCKECKGNSNTQKMLPL
ncbi:hypothetical protein BK126_13165 [Paenibacillus sp. FSL H7-0326]|nr:hypothetical protein BK126_13165 [Paenibacillus sp. FSL H7-0326]